MRIFITLMFILCGFSVGATDFRIMGRGKLFTNDYFGDGDDRWRSGSYTRSTFIGTGWDGVMPRSGVYELRFRGQLIAPTDQSVRPKKGERPFVGMAAIGLARHFRFRETVFKTGAELVAIGPQTGVSRFVKKIHKVLGFKPSRAAEDQLPNDLIPTGSFEASRLIARSTHIPFQLRPFVEAQAGVETYARIGMDVFLGNGVAGDLVTRDVVTGQIVTVISMRGMAGLTPMIGADIARVYDSYYLPSSSQLDIKKWRMRVRGGVRSLGSSRDVFMGLTWLSPEYEGQPGGQVLGSLSIDHHF